MKSGVSRITGCNWVGKLLGIPPSGDLVLFFCYNIYAGEAFLARNRALNSNISDHKK